MKVLEDVQTYVIDKVDEDSVDAIKELFDDFRKEFEKAMEEEAKQNKVSKKKGSKGAGGDAAPKRTRKPTPYNMFVSENMKRFKQENPALNGKETMKMAMEAWSALSEDDKKAYREKVLAEQENSSDKEMEEEPKTEESEEEKEPEVEEKKPKKGGAKGGKKGAK